MAKPYGDQAGNGLHIHCSLLDRDGQNIFDDGSAQGSAALRHAIAGLIAASAESFLIFAPHLNSYRRFLANAHAPTAANWGYENRSTAIRIPASPGPSRRFEHRLAGADANPYLVTAAVLAALLHGLLRKQEPSAPVIGNGYDHDHAPPTELPLDWLAAIESFEQGAIIEPLMGGLFRRAFAACKRQERLTLQQRITDVEYATYLGFL
jgi:glutamine synthetase